MFKPPTIAQLRETADELGMAPTDEYLEATQRIVAPLVAAYRALDGVADVNDRSRDVDRLDLVETIHGLGAGTAPLRVAQIPRYVDLLRHVFERMGWDEEGFRTYRCQVEYPVYGSQVVMAFDPPDRATDGG